MTCITSSDFTSAQVETRVRFKFEALGKVPGKWDWRRQHAAQQLRHHPRRTTHRQMIHCWTHRRRRRRRRSLTPHPPFRTANWLEVWKRLRAHGDRQHAKGRRAREIRSPSTPRRQSGPCHHARRSWTCTCRASSTKNGSCAAIRDLSSCAVRRRIADRAAALH